MKIATHKTSLLIQEAYTLYFNPHRDSTPSSSLLLQSASSPHKFFISPPSICIDSQHIPLLSSFNHHRISTSYPSLILQSSSSLHILSISHSSILIESHSINHPIKSSSLILQSSSSLHILSISHSSIPIESPQSILLASLNPHQKVVSSKSSILQR
ncbi:hypothetical protein CDAR_209121 [Caerostris darwini]|uniref:Uncharacterized protein n=1 Tax=Caerostris darwini TaxID=1538125 RepID=A0AAV4VGM5_9ARAC|nr:hypothetical protein CDAR_209121 [Caerostris darwini]